MAVTLVDPLVDPLAQARVDVEQRLAQVQQRRRQQDSRVPGMGKKPTTPGSQEKAVHQRFRKGLRVLPTPARWTQMTETERTNVLRSLLPRLAPRLEINRLGQVHPELALEEIEKLAAWSGDGRLHRWATSVQRGREFRCGNPKLRGRHDGSGVTIMRIACGQRGCQSCLANRSASEASYYARAFGLVDAPVFAVFTTQRKASGIVSYATKLGYAAVAIPQPDGKAVVVTTHQRTDASPLELLIEDDQRGVWDPLRRWFEAVPAYSILDGDEQHRVRPNRHLRAAIEADSELAGQHPESFGRRPDDYDPNEWTGVSVAAIVYAVDHRFELEFATTGAISHGQISRILLPDDPNRQAERAEFLRLCGMLERT